MRLAFAAVAHPLRYALLLFLTITPVAVHGASALEDHGVSPSAKGLVRFLEEGWGSQGRRPPAAGETWMENTELLTEAWRALALRREEIRDDPAMAARVSALGLRYATGDLPNAISGVIDQDLYRTPVDELAAERDRRMDYLRHNGMVALGIFGLPTRELIDKARAVYDTEERPIVKVSYARALGLLGDPQALGDLADLAASEDRGAAVAAAQSLYFLTGRLFRMHAQMAVEPRKEAAQSIREWWESVRENPPGVVREMALQRQMHGGPDTRPAPSSPLHADLRASAIKSDAADVYGSRTAWRRLMDQGPELAEKLEPILGNPREDLDIRQEAIRWYARLRGDDSRKWLKRLRKDPNPEIEALARELLENR